MSRRPRRRPRRARRTLAAELGRRDRLLGRRRGTAATRPRSTACSPCCGRSGAPVDRADATSGAAPLRRGRPRCARSSPWSSATWASPSSSTCGCRRSAARDRVEVHLEPDGGEPLRFELVLDDLPEVGRGRRRRRASTSCAASALDLGARRSTSATTTSPSSCGGGAARQHPARGAAPGAPARPGRSHVGRLRRRSTRAPRRLGIGPDVNDLDVLGAWIDGPTAARSSAPSRSSRPTSSSRTSRARTRRSASASGTSSTSTSRRLPELAALRRRPARCLDDPAHPGRSPRRSRTAASSTTAASTGCVRPCSTS